MEFKHRFILESVYIMYPQKYDKLADPLRRRANLVDHASNYCFVSILTNSFELNVLCKLQTEEEHTNHRHIRYTHH